MDHQHLARELRSLERDLPTMRERHAHDFGNAFDAHVARLVNQADDPDDAIYVIERAETMLGDQGFE
jgi:hypothetical protein